MIKSLSIKINNHLEQVANAIFKSYMENLEPNKKFSEVVQVLVVEHLKQQLLNTGMEASHSLHRKTHRELMS